MSNIEPTSSVVTIKTTIRRGIGSLWTLIVLPIHAIKVAYLTQGNELFASRLSHWGDTARGINVLRAATSVPALVRGIFERG